MIKLLDLGLCDQEGILRTFKIVNLFLTITKILVPIIIIVVGSIDLFKVVTDGKDDEMKKVVSQLVRRVIAGLIIFMLPTIIDFFMNLNVKYKDTATAFAGCSSCLTDAKECDTLIAVAEAQSNEELTKPENHNLTPAEEEAWKKKSPLYQAGKNSTNERSNDSNNSNNSNSGNTNESSQQNIYYRENQVVGGGKYFDPNNVTKISGLTEQELVQVLQNSTAYKGKAKVYIPLAKDLILAEKNHGVNAFYLIGLYSYESGWLTSALTTNCNNIGGVRYYQQTYGNGKTVTNCNNGYAGFDSISEFVDFHANLLEKKYLTPGGSHYYGTTVANVAKDYGSSNGVDTIIRIATNVSS